MKKFLSIPVVVVLALSVIACGKKNDDGAVAVTPAPVVVPPIPAPTPGTPDISQWCYNQGGTYYQNACKIRYTTYLNSWYVGLNIAIGVNAYINDQVVISGSGINRVSVGGVNYGSSFTSQSQGPILVSADRLFDDFRVSSVQITRCYNNSGYGVPCP